MKDPKSQEKKWNFSRSTPTRNSPGRERHPGPTSRHRRLAGIEGRGDVTRCHSVKRRTSVHVYVVKPVISRTSIGRGLNADFFPFFFRNRKEKESRCPDGSVARISRGNRARHFAGRACRKSDRLSFRGDTSDLPALALSSLARSVSRWQVCELADSRHYPHCRLFSPPPLSLSFSIITAIDQSRSSVSAPPSLRSRMKARVVDRHPRIRMIHRTIDRDAPRVTKGQSAGIIGEARGE